MTALEAVLNGSKAYRLVLCDPPSVKAARRKASYILGTRIAPYTAGNCQAARHCHVDFELPPRLLAGGPRGEVELDGSASPKAKGRGKHGKAFTKDEAMMPTAVPAAAACAVHMSAKTATAGAAAVELEEHCARTVKQRLSESFCSGVELAYTEVASDIQFRSTTLDSVDSVRQADKAKSVEMATHPPVANDDIESSAGLCSMRCGRGNASLSKGSSIKAVARWCVLASAISVIKPRSIGCNVGPRCQPQQDQEKVCPSIWLEERWHDRNNNSCILNCFF
eukprot:gnl/TRDRNA2_/TRDRNA2_181658_c0_seq1.p1 gnl/TRDRNA2_/TRDRNA2_181658_c0~~gnl/TRDRNA2_/TRDRNA2_181658_c0_seq1.p1  ORF type:complete len:312 (+),score=51.11 gnl/TRDRNA2_/TRDRNA2_181658_c0_seq1:99-938(+)